ncbi:MAG: pyridoxamine 5'-phosphate oxidase family protein [Candidatus Methanomethylophilaceae archaeon]|nr:pyridoxamine 5'-phosphate oxidase family protein [Candidatus Methanomethylophilaceae archaeon]
MADPATTKVLVTASESGRPHAIVCGSIVAPSPDKVIVGEVLMKRAAANLAANPKAAFLVSSGMESYEIIVRNPVRIAEGPILEQMNENLAKINLKAAAVWAFDVCAVYNEGANPQAGTQIA